MRRGGIGWGVGALLAASAALGAFALRAAAPNAARVRSSMRADAEGAVAAAAESFAAELEALRAGRVEGALELERQPSEDAHEAEIDAPDPSLLAFHREEIDRAVRAGDLDAARAHAARVAADGRSPWLAAWATTQAAALARRAQDGAAERDALDRLATLPIELRDERGLSRALAARARLLELDGAGFDERLALYEALVADRRALDDEATAALAARVRAELAATSPPDAEAARELERAIELERERARRRSLDASGLAELLAPGEARSADSPPDALDPQRREVGWIGARAPDEAPRAYALEATALIERVLARPELAVFERAGLRLVLSEEDDASSARLAARDVPLEGAKLRAGAFALDLDARLASERRRFALVAALIAAALGVIGAAGFATARAVARESRAAREREAFVAAVSHELRTPLAATRLLAELLAQGGVEEQKVVEFARRIGAESERLSRLVSSILELARLEGAGGEPATLEALDLREVAGDAAERFAPIARDAGFELALEAPEEPLVVLGRRDALAGALLELLDNARKHADAPHGLELALERNGTSARIRVLDRGRGIPQDERERIFQPFARLGDELTRDRPGAGLGLALVQRVARAHGGTVRCEARAGGGSVFVIELPLAPAAE